LATKGGSDIEARQRLSQLGVPPSFHDDILKHARAVHVEQGHLLVGVVTTGAVVALGMGMMWGIGWLEDFVARQALDVAERNGGVLIRENVGFGPLVLFFAVLLLGIPLSLMTTSRAKKRATTAHSLIVSDRRLLLGIEKIAATANSADDFLDHLNANSSFILLAPIAALLALGAFLTAAESRSFFVAGPNGIEHHRFWPPFTVATYDYSDATELVVGCNHTDDDDFLIYDVHFSDMDFPIGLTFPTRGSLIEALEQIDAQLPANVPRRRWDWLGRNAMAPQCLARWNGSVENGPARVERLLRITASSE
jgi:hypothetical protein